SHGRLSPGADRPPPRGGPGIRPRLGTARPADRRAKERGTAVPRRRRRLAVQVRRGRLSLAVPEARGEDRGRSGLRDHAGRLGCPEAPRAPPVPGGPWPPDPGPRERLRPRPPGRRA